MRRALTGWRLAKGSWSVLKADRSLAAYPAIAIVAAMAGFWILAGVGIALANGVSVPGLAVPFLVMGIFVAVYFVVYFNVALAAAAQQSIDGRDTSLSDGLAVARSRRGFVAKWALLETALGLLLAIIGSLLSNAGAKTVSSLLSDASGLAWTVATFFVIPVAALEGLGPRDATSRSINLIRARWGEAVLGRTGISMVVFLLAVVPVLGLAVLATELAPNHPTLAGVGVALFVLGIIVANVVATALGMIFRVELYRYAMNGQVTGTFDPADVELAFRPATSRST